MYQGVDETYYKRFLNRFKHSGQGHAPNQHYSERVPIYRQRQDVPATMESRSTDITEIDGIDSSKVGNFPFSSLRLLGGFQIGLGVTCLVLGIVDLFLYLYVSQDYEDDTLSAMTIASVPIWCGLWFIIAGAMGTCMSLEQKSTLSYFKSTFMVLSILCCGLFGPILCAVEIYIVVLRTRESADVFEWLFPLLIAFFAFNEIICALITTAICCCCSPLNQAKVRVLYTTQMDELSQPMHEKRHLDTPEIFYTESSRRELDKQRAPMAPVHHAQPPPPRRTYEDTHFEPERWEDAHQGGHGGHREAVKNPRAVISSDSPPLTYSRPPTYDGGSNNYRRLKQMAVPGRPEAW